MGKNKKIFLIFFCLLIFISLFQLYRFRQEKGSPAKAAGDYHYVRAGATGLNNGSDWTNAWTTLPATLVRGDTYYIADGTYGSYTFDDAVNGELYITIKKATSSDHGTNTGWDASYGDGQGVFDKTIQFTRSYYVFDGATGGGRDSWRSGHGFKFDVKSGITAIIIGAPFSGPVERDDILRSNIIVKHVEVEGNQIPCTGGKGIYLSSGTRSNITMSHLWIHDLTIPLQGADMNDSVLEESVLERQASSPSCHSEGWAAWGPSYRITVRNNIIADISGTAFIALGAAYDWDIYNNIFMCTDGSPYGCSVGNGIIGTTDHDWETTSNMKIYHNAFVNLNNAVIDLNSPYGPPAFGNLVYNNIWFKSLNVGIGSAEYDYNMYLNSSYVWNYAGISIHDSEGDYDPFVDWKNGDFRLKSATQPGISLSSPYNLDIFGNIRGADGVWDRGAYEYLSQATPTPSLKSGDLNSDTRVNSVDMGIMMSWWGSNSRPKSDINQDGYVNSVDFGIMLSQWTG